MERTRTWLWSLPAQQQLTQQKSTDEGGESEKDQKQYG
jgi:hypothetical protein